MDCFIIAVRQQGCRNQDMSLVNWILGTADLRMVHKKQDMPFFCKHLPLVITKLLFVCLFFPMLYLVVKLVDALYILCRYGTKAYSDGLRFQNSHLGILNNGEELEWYIHFLRGVFVLLLIFIFTGIVIWLCDLCFLYISQRLKRKNPLSGDSPPVTNE